MDRHIESSYRTQQKAPPQSHESKCVLYYVGFFLKDGLVTYLKALFH